MNDDARSFAGTPDVAAVQRRTLRLLFMTQIISGVGVAIGASVGALLVAELVGTSASGLAQSSVVIGAAVLALPATALVQRSGRRLSLTATYVVATAGALLIVLAAVRNSTGLLFPGFFVFGAATAANMQARYAAVDLAPTSLRGRHLSMIVWATTIGAVAGPNLTSLAGATLSGYGVPTLAGPFVFSAALFVVAALLLTLFMRPDPAVLARATHPGHATTTPRRVGLRAAFAMVWSHAPARLGMLSVAVGHMVMVGVMAMTPVHIRSGAHDAADTLRIVGVVLSFHIAGMYALSPVVGWMTDRLTARPVILTGLACLLAACALAGTAGHDATRLAAGLMMLGIGWSCTMVAGSTLLSGAVPVDMRASAQGLSDFVMGLAGASAGALSGVIVGEWSYPILALIAALAALPFIVFVTRTVRA